MRWDYAINDEVRRLGQFAVERRSHEEPFDMVVAVGLFEASEEESVCSLLHEYVIAGAPLCMQFVPLNTMSTAFVQVSVAHLTRPDCFIAA